MLANNQDTARFNMVAQQVRPCEVIDDAVIHAMEKIAREDFIPDEYKGLAYADVEVPLGHGQTMLKPLVEAQILQALEIKPTDKVLEVGSGSGYLTACIAEMCSQVISYEIVDQLADSARSNLEALGIKNAVVRNGDVFFCGVDKASIDVIAVTGSLPEYDKALQELLAPNGRMFVIVGEAPNMQARVYKRSESGNVWYENVFETVVPPLQNAPQANQFSF